MTDEEIQEIEERWNSYRLGEHLLEQVMNGPDESGTRSQILSEHAAALDISKLIEHIRSLKHGD